MAWEVSAMAVIFGKFFMGLLDNLNNAVNGWSDFKGVKIEDIALKRENTCNPFYCRGEVIFNVLFYVGVIC